MEIAKEQISIKFNIKYKNFNLYDYKGYDIKTIIMSNLMIIINLFYFYFILIDYIYYY